MQPTSYFQRQLTGEKPLSDLEEFKRDSIFNLEKMCSDENVKKVSQEWINQTGKHNYAYNWRWLGLPIIQLPADIVATQELIWKIEPTVIIETGVARGGSLIFNASQLAMLDLCKYGSSSIMNSERRCIGIDIDIRPHNRGAIESHPLSPMIQMVEGSSTDEITFNKVMELIKPDDKIMVILDSNHTHAHVKEELVMYSPLVSLESYIVVHDTGIEFSPDSAFKNRDWGVGNNPLTAILEFLDSNDTFQVDKLQSDKLLITSSPNGYLQRVR